MRSEADRISRKTFKEIAEFAERIEGFEPYAYIIRKTDQGRCIFLKDNTCMIYPARPLVCRFYPFELNMEGTKHVFAYSAECPAIGKGPRVKKEYFRRLFEMAKMQMKKDTEARRSATTAVRKRKSRRTGR
jgi:Fe-S-cluster containining protein